MSQSVSLVQRISRILINQILCYQINEISFELRMENNKTTVTLCHDIPTNYPFHCLLRLAWLIMLWLCGIAFQEMLLVDYINVAVLRKLLALALYCWLFLAQCSEDFLYLFLLWTIDQHLCLWNYFVMWFYLCMYIVWIVSIFIHLRVQSMFAI